VRVLDVIMSSSLRGPFFFYGLPKNVLNIHR
jgi:hypothetical protein